MTGAASRRRGIRAEQAVASWLRVNGWPHARRTLAGDGRQPGDIDVHPAVAIEVKDWARSAWPTWMAQAVTARGDRGIIIVVRRTRGSGDPGCWEARWTVDAGATWTTGDLRGASRSAMDRLAPAARDTTSTEEDITWQ